VSKKNAREQIRSTLDQINPRPTARTRSRLRRASKWSPLAAVVAVAGVFAWRYRAVNDRFATTTDD
jgi:hypothetical protein